MKRYSLVITGDQALVIRYDNHLVRALPVDQQELGKRIANRLNREPLLQLLH